MEKLEPDPDNSVVPSCLMPGEQHTRRGAEDEEQSSATTMCHVSAVSTGRYCANVPTALDQAESSHSVDKHVCATLRLAAKKVPILWVYRDLAVRLLYIRCEREDVRSPEKLSPA